MPQISICLPTYNGERFICEAIDNALAQSFSDFELLIADDRSSDQTWQIVQSYAEKDKRIKAWQNSSNKGLFANYNECISHASGDYIKLFAQDDIWDKDILERMLAAFATTNGIAMAVCNRAWVDESGKELPLDQAFTESGRVDGWDVIAKCLSKFTNWIGEPSTVMFPREFAGFGFDTQFYHLGDLEYWVRILAQGDLYFVNEPLCKFRRHAGSTTNKNLIGLRFAIDMLRMVDVCEEMLRKVDLDPDNARLRAMSNTASFIRHLSDRGEASLEELLAQKPKDDVHAARLLDEYKELAYYALMSAAAREDAWEARLAAKEQELISAENRLAALLDSKAWRSTSIFRHALRGVKRIRRRAP